MLALFTFQASFSLSYKRCSTSAPPVYLNKSHYVAQPPSAVYLNKSHYVAQPPSAV